MTDRRRISIAAAIALAAALTVYVSLLPANVSFGDEAEAQTVPYILGIAHSTGFPAYTLAGWLFSHALPIGSVAWRLNAFAALCTALSAAGVVLIAGALGSGVPPALFAGCAFAFGPIVFGGALNANAQILSGVCGVYALLAAVIFARSGAPRAFVAACACCALGIAAHPASMWILPAIVVALAWQYSRIRVKLLASGLGAFVTPLLLYAYFPLRSAYVAAHGLDPNAAAPLFGAGNFDWDTNAPRTTAGFLNEVLGRHEHAGSAVAYTFNPHVLANAAAWWFNFAAAQYPIWLFVLAAAGIAILGRRDLRSLSVLAAGTLFGIAFAHVYRSDAHIDRYVFVSLAVTAALAAASARPALPQMPAHLLRVLVAVVLAVIAGTGLTQTRTALIAHKSIDSQTTIDAARTETPDNAIIVAEWNDAATLGYGAFVEHTLGSRLIVTSWPYDYLDRFDAWSKTRPVYIARPSIAGLWGASFAPAPLGRRHRAPGLRN
jgi:hypothetical protein